MCFYKRLFRSSSRKKEKKLTENARKESPKSGESSDQLKTDFVGPSEKALEFATNTMPSFRSPSICGEEEHCIIGGGRCAQGDKKLLKWVCESRVALPEYQRAARTICVRPELMAESRAAAAAAELMKGEKPGQCATMKHFKKVVIEAIAEAWPQKSRSVTCCYVRIPGLAEGNPYECALSMFKSMVSWKQILLSRALQVLKDRENSKDELAIVFGLLIRGANECQSRKDWSFYNILTRCAPSPPSQSSNSVAHNDAVILDVSRKRLLAAACGFLDDEKDAAFRTHFTEPTQMYLDAIHHGSPDVVVHGANTYLAVLAATLGIRLSRDPFVGDDGKGLAPFLDHPFAGDALAALHAPKNFGKSFMAIAACRSPQLASGARAPRHDREWILQGEGGPASSVKAALGHDQKVRARAARYLEGFAAPFAASRLLPRLVSRIFQDDALLAALNIELSTLKGEGLRIEGDNDDDAYEDGQSLDVRSWLWDLDAEPEPAFRLPRALVLFSRIGFVKASLTPRLVNSSASAAATMPL